MKEKRTLDLEMKMLLETGSSCLPVFKEYTPSIRKFQISSQPQKSQQNEKPQDRNFCKPKQKKYTYFVCCIEKHKDLDC